MEDEGEESGDDHFQVDAVLERGPSPPESESSNAYEWSYEEQFKQVTIPLISHLLDFFFRISFASLLLSRG